MNLATHHIRRFDPWLRGITVLYLLGALFLAAAHQHHDGLQGHDCALCTVAHAPATIAAGVDLQLAPATAERVLAITTEQGWESDTQRTTRSRAPPLV